MHRLSEWFTRNPVASNLLMLVVILAGLFTLKSIRIEGFPTIPPSSVTISTVYPGADAEQLDRGVTMNIQKALEGMPGIKRTYASSSEGYSELIVEKNSAYDMDRFQNEIRTRIDSISNLPQKAERPQIFRDEFTVEALIFQIYGDTDLQTLQEVSRIVRARLLNHPRITKLDNFGLLKREIHIEVDEERLKAYGITQAEVEQALRSGSVKYRTGALTNDSAWIMVRADSTAESVRDLKALPLMRTPDGSTLTIGDVAEVKDTFDQDELYARFNGSPTVGFMVYSSKNGHLLQVSDAAHEVLRDIRKELPDGIKVDIWGEYSTYMRDRLSLLASNAWQGLLIVFVLLALFLDIRLAFWVAMGIPVSIAGTLMLMGERFLSYSLNDITTFGIIIVLGILVDDAIVVGESVFEQRRLSSDPVEAAVKGVHRVSTATIFGCFTTIAAFFPILLIDNDLGKVFASFSVVVIVSLLVSLLESKLILPAHLAGMKNRKSGRSHFVSLLFGRIQDGAARGLKIVNTRFYQPALKRILRYRYAAVIVLLTIAVIGGIGLYKGWVRTVFFPEIPGQIISVKMKMAKGSGLALTRRNVEIIEDCATELNAALQEEEGSGKAPIARLLAVMTGPDSAELYAELEAADQRDAETLEILDRWRERVGVLEGARKIEFSGSFETAGGFSVILSARDEKVLEAGVDRIRKELLSLEGVKAVRDTLQKGEPQIRVVLKPEASRLGITTADLATLIGDSLGGVEVQRFQGQHSEVKVRLLTRKEQRRNIGNLAGLMVRNDKGESFPLLTVADLVNGYAPSRISRRNGNRVVTISAELDKDLITPSEAFDWLKRNAYADLKASYPQLVLKGTGELEEIGEMKGELKRAMILIIVLIFVFLAVPLKSYTLPLVIMSVIPFGFVGTLIGHAVMGHPLSLLSFFGMLAVMGIVVNDSLVMLTRYNEMKEEGTDTATALVQAGGSRFRAILLTTLTTVCGLIPLLSETSEQAQYLIPAAISLAWGELFATPITLFIIPVLVNIGNDIKGLRSASGLWPARRNEKCGARDKETLQEVI